MNYSTALRLCLSNHNLNSGFIATTSNLAAVVQCTQVELKDSKVYAGAHDTWIDFFNLMNLQGDCAILIATPSDR